MEADSQLDEPKTFEVWSEDPLRIVSPDMMYIWVIIYYSSTNLHILIIH